MTRRRSVIDHQGPQDLAHVSRRRRVACVSAHRPAELLRCQADGDSVATMLPTFVPRQLDKQTRCSLTAAFDRGFRWFSYVLP